MSVFATVTGLFTVPYPSADPRYPTIRFVTAGVLVGDGSGGIAQIFFVVVPTAQAPSGLIYGVRRVHTVAGGGAAIPVTALAQRFIMVLQQTVDEVIGIPLTTVHNGQSSIGDTGKRDALLGFHPPNDAASSQVAVTWATNTNAETYSAYVEGFIWQPQALNNGGPLFPGEIPPG